MKLFTVGPVQMYPQTKEVAAQQLPYFRDQSFSNIMLDMEANLKKLLHVKQGKAVFLTGSGSSAMESLIACAFRPQNKVLIINGGSFGARFVKLCEVYHIPYDELKLPYPMQLTEEMLNKMDGSQYDALIVNIHETSTGQLYPIELLSAFAKKYHLYLVVDAISSFLSDPYHMDRYGIDATILASQKALACAPGISMIIMQNHFYETMIEPKEDICLYLSIKEHVRNMERGQTPNTPAVGILLELADRIASLMPQGEEQEMEKIKARATYFRKLVQKLPIEIPSFPLSNTLTPLYFPEGNAEAVYTYLRDQYQLYLTPSGGDLKKYLLRVGHLGDLELQDYDLVYEKLKEILS